MQNYFDTVFFFFLSLSMFWPI